MAEEDTPKRHIGVRVVSASGLQTKHWFSKCNPYFTARVGVKGYSWHDRTFQVTSEPVKNSQNPGEEETSVLCKRFMVSNRPSMKDVC